MKKFAFLLSAVFITVEIAPIPIALAAHPLAPQQTQIIKTKIPTLPNMMVLGKFFQDLGDVYKMTDPKDPRYLKLIEKLAGGGIGRMLRYRGWVAGEEKWVDLEFIYEDRDAKLTILDYESRKFFKAFFNKKNEVFFYPVSSNDIKGFKKQEAGSPVSTSKSLAMKKTAIHATQETKTKIHAKAEMGSPSHDRNNSWMRAPPSKGAQSNE